MRELVARALAEDLGDGDVTGEATVPADLTATARIVQKAPGVVFGLDLVVETMAQTGVAEVDTLTAEGEGRQDVPAEVLVARGSPRALLAAERTALNFLGHLSGVATLSARYVEAIAGTDARILDTRKTTPGLRRLEKAAGAGGGGAPHPQGTPPPPGPRPPPPPPRQQGPADDARRGRTARRPRCRRQA